jgi:hypothetical protein
MTAKKTLLDKRLDKLLQGVDLKNELLRLKQIIKNETQRRNDRKDKSA